MSDLSKTHDALMEANRANDELKSRAKTFHDIDVARNYQRSINQGFEACELLSDQQQGESEDGE